MFLAVPSRVHHWDLRYYGPDAFLRAMAGTTRLSSPVVTISLHTRRMSQDPMRLVQRLKHRRWMRSGPPPNAAALLCQEAMDSPHLRGELLWVIRRRFLHRP